MTDQQWVQSDGERITELEDQSALDQVRIADHVARRAVDVRRILDLNSQSVLDAGRIAELDAQGLLDHGQIEALENQIRLDQAIIAALAEQGEIDQGQIENLNRSLINCRKIGAAVGIVMARTSVDQAAAFHMLVRVSQRTHRKLYDVADDVVFTGALDT